MTYQSTEPSAGAGLNTPAVALAYLGAAPLVLAALGLVADPAGFGASAPRFMTIYGAALLVFFGGVRWGVAVMKPSGPSARALIGAAAPVALVMPLMLDGPERVKMLAVMVMVLVLLLDDLAATRRGDGPPAWHLGVRVPLTVLIEVAFLVALAAMSRG